jgi:peptide/nickel transport system ATP-binding protein
MTLWLRQLEVHLGSRRLLGPLDLELLPGHCLGMVGESGSGKSLTALALLGLLPSGLRASGALAHDGTQIALGSRAHAALRGRVLAWVPQDPLAALHPLRTVGAQMIETLRAHGVRDAAAARVEAQRLFERVQLPEPTSALRRFPHQFSGGQRQRITIALALCSRPKMLIADEPTSSLDARIARDVLDLLDMLRREAGLGLILISHDLPLVGAYAEHVLVLRRGDVIERGATREVFASPQHAYTRELIEADRLPLTLARNARSSLSPQGGERVPDRASEGPPLLRAEAMRMHYPRALKPALDNVSLTLHRGEGLALVGESGSGKSTLGRAVLRLLHGAQGRVWLDDVELTALKGAALRAMRKRIGVVFQDPYASLDPRMRVADIIAEPLRIHGMGDTASRTANVDALLMAVGLDAEMATRYPHQFSGGQRQRIAIARALACDPDLLVCDEAVSALDAHHRREILALLATLKRERGLALLFITHDLSAAAAVAERIAVLEAGKIVEIGNASDVLRNPQHAHTRALLAARVL